MTYSNVGYATDSGVLIKIMPISPQAQQMSALQQQMQQAQAQQMLAPLIQKLMAAQQQPTPMQNPGMNTPTAAPPGSGSPLLKQLMGGINPMGGPQGPPSPNTLGVNQPIPMQMPPVSPQGEQRQPPLPPDPTDMQM